MPEVVALALKWYARHAYFDSQSRIERVFLLVLLVPKSAFEDPWKRSALSCPPLIEFLSLLIIQEEPHHRVRNRLQLTDKCAARFDLLEFAG